MRYIVAHSQIADIIALESNGTEFTRPIYAGNAILKVNSSDKDKIKIVTVRTTSFDKAAVGSGSAAVEEITPVKAECTCTHAGYDQPDHSVAEITVLTAAAATKFISEELTVSSRPDLSSASKVVSGGRALKSQENFEKVLDPLADALGAGELRLPESRRQLTHSRRCLASCCRCRLCGQLAAGRPDRKGESSVVFGSPTVLTTRSSLPSSTSLLVSLEPSNIWQE